MNTRYIHEIGSEKVVPISVTASTLRLFFPELVDEILESFTECSDVEIIQEIVDTLNLDIICVIENSHVNMLIHGFIYGRGVLV